MSSRQIHPYRQLFRARAFIHQHYASAINLRELAQQADFSHYHFLRLFSAAFKQTPHQYLIQHRIERAKDLLLAGELSTTEICYAVGFQSLGSFSSLFHRTVGTTPSSYRRRLFSGIQLQRRFVPYCFFRMPVPRTP